MLTGSVLKSMHLRSSAEWKFITVERWYFETVLLFWKERCQRHSTGELKLEIKSHDNFFYRGGPTDRQGVGGGKESFSKTHAVRVELDVNFWRRVLTLYVISFCVAESVVVLPL
jgi:hypothetical protein